MTFKSGSEVTQGHWKWYHSIDWVRFPIAVLYLRRHVFRYWTCKYTMTLILVLGVTQGHRNGHVSIRLLWPPINVPQYAPNYELISYRFRDNRWFLSKSAIFPKNIILHPRWREFYINAWGQKLEWWCCWAEKEVWRHLHSSDVWYNIRKWRTDRQQRPALTHSVAR